ncbi:MAG: hypothetical protein IPH84_08725 [Bacteroidales bacterium]|nr:hypothetical protein [Bacteroidales bacterium]
MKPLLFFIITSFLFLSPCLLFAQAEGNDIVYLKNGSILYGEVTDMPETNSIKVKIIGNNQLVFPRTEILKIEKTGKPSKLPIQLVTEISFLGGSNNSAGFTIASAYKFCSWGSAGVGTGVEFFEYQVLPVYGDFRYKIFRGNFSPYLFGRFGYSFPLSKAQVNDYSHVEYKGGILAAAGGGIQKSISEHISLIFAVGYRYQKLRTVTTYQYWYSGNNSQIDERIDGLNRITVSLGPLF